MNHEWLFVDPSPAAGYPYERFVGIEVQSLEQVRIRVRVRWRESKLKSLGRY